MCPLTGTILGTPNLFVMGSINDKPIFIYHKLVLSLRFESTLKIFLHPTQNLKKKPLT